MTTRQQRAAQITNSLAHHTGTTGYTRLYKGLLLTDWGLALAEQAECFRLMDIIYSVLEKITDEDAFLDIAVRHDDEQPEIGHNKVYQPRTDNDAVVVIHNGFWPSSDSFKVFHRQEIPFTDLCFSRLQLYIGTYHHENSTTERVVYLPSEY